MFLRKTKKKVAITSAPFRLNALEHCSDKSTHVNGMNLKKH